MKLQPMVSDEILNKLSKDKQIAILKAERNALLALSSVESGIFSWAQKATILHSACIHISTIMRAAESEQ
ncbi:hypothetical protein [Pseudoalteromonas sp.]|uniref:hypothetical protein n=1 Tax=Pseudoalteromonas sp. TaxID=53249 RepID=UPI003D118877